MSNETRPVIVTPKEHSILLPTLLIAAMLVILLALKFGGSVAGPIMFFIFLAILVVPLFNGLKKRGVAPWLALLIMLGGIVAAFVGLLWLVISSFGQMLEGLAQYSIDFQANIQGLTEALQSIQINPEVVYSISDSLFGYIGSFAAGMLSNIITMVAGAFMALIALTFIMLESDNFGKRLHRGLGDESDLLKRMNLFQGSLLSYVIARVKLNLMTGLGVFVMLLLFNVDYPVLWGVLAFFLSFIPYIGLAVAAIPPILLGTAESGLTVGIILGLGYLIINQVIEQIVEPKVVGTEMTLSPTLTLFSVIFWTWMLGGIGAMLAGPLAALMILVLGSFDDTRWIAILFSSDDSPLVTGIMPASPEGTADVAAEA